MSEFVDSADPYPTRNPCAFEGCNLSVEEHHRLSRGYAAEVAALKIKVRQPDRIDLSSIDTNDLLTEISRRINE